MPRTWWTAALLWLAGCQGTYRAQVKSVRALAQADQFDAAAQKAAAGQGAYDKGDRVLALLDEGALLADAGKPKESNARLLEAYDRLLEHYRKGAGTKAAASLVSSSAGDYLAEDHERVLLHLFTVQNYLVLGARDDALVEARRLTSRLGVLADVKGHGRRYREDGLAQWLSGVLFEEDHDLSNALLSLKAAALAWKASPALLAMACGDARRVARAASLPLEDLEACKDAPPAEAVEAPLGAFQAEVILIHRAGLVPARNEVRKSCGMDGAGSVCVTADATRSAAVARWAAVALPALETPPVLLPQVALRVSHAASDAASDARAPGLLAEDVSKIVTQTFADHLPELATQATTRALARLGTSAAAGVGAGALAAHEESKPDASKQGLPEQKKEQKAVPAPPPPRPSGGGNANNAVLIGLAVGTLSEMVLSETEHADTRTWATLPARINVARLRVAAGKQHVQAELLDAQGKLVRTIDLGELNLIGGQRRWLQVRSAE